MLTRAEASLERSARKVDAAAGTMDFSGIREEVVALRRRVEATPRFGALVTTALITAFLTVRAVRAGAEVRRAGRDERAAAALRRALSGLRRISGAGP